MKAWVVGFSLVCGAHSASAADTILLRYDELQTLVRKNNKAVRSSEEDVNTARQRIGTLEQSFLPKAGLEAGIASEKEVNGSGDSAPFWKIDVQANLYRGGRDKVDQLLRESQVLIKEMNAHASLRSELFKAKVVYVQLASTRQIKNLTRQSLDDYDGLRQSIARKSKAGLMTGSGLLSTQLAIEELKRDLILLESEEHELQDRMALVLGLPHDSSLKLETGFDRLPTQGHASIEDESIQKLPEIQTLSLQSERSKIAGVAQNEWWRPDIDVFASYTGFRMEETSEMRSLPEREMAIGIRLSLDLPSKARLGSEISSRKSEILALDLQRDHLIQEIEHKLHEYGREMNTQTRIIQTYDQGIGKAERLAKELRGEFERGLGSSEEIAGAIRSVYEMRRKRLESLSAFYLAQSGLETMANTGED